MAIRFCQPFFLMEMYSVKCVLVILSLSFSWPRSTTKNGDLGHNAGGSLLCLFKILVSREGRPRPVWRVASRQDSNPLPLSRGETHSARGGLFGIEFQSTPLSRGETLNSRTTLQRYQFQSTPLSRGETHNIHRPPNAKFQSTPLSRGETGINALLPQIGYISNHSPLTRGNTFAILLSAINQSFQSTPLSRGETTRALIRYISRQRFQSTPLSRGETRCCI